MHKNTKYGILSASVTSTEGEHRVNASRPDLSPDQLVASGGVHFHHYRDRCQRYLGCVGNNQVANTQLRNRRHGWRHSADTYRHQEELWGQRMNISRMCCAIAMVLLISIAVALIGGFACLVGIWLVVAAGLITYDLVNSWKLHANSDYNVIAVGAITASLCVGASLCVRTTMIRILGYEPGLDHQMVIAAKIALCCCIAMTIIAIAIGQAIAATEKETA